MKRVTVCLLVLVCVNPARSVACMQNYGPTNYVAARADSVMDQLQEHTLLEPWEQRRDRLRAELARTGDFRVKNDLATTLAHAGDAAGAVKLLEEIEAVKPGLYTTAANLGTAYELAGDDRKALVWIRKGIERNPDSHEGTEWLHVRILEAKLELRKNPGWLNSHSISGLVKSAKPIQSLATGNRGEKLSTDGVKTALLYQLHERLQFVRPSDAVVGALLLDLGDLIGEETTGDGGASKVFQLAEDYLHGLPNAAPLLEIAHKKTLHAQRSVEKGLPTSPLAILEGLFGAAAAIYLSLKLRVPMRWSARRTVEANES